MKLKSVYTTALAVALLTAASPARGDIDTPPVPIGGWEAFHSKVVYPELAQQAGMDGEVLIHVYIDENGQATKMKVVSGSQKTGFVQSACDAFRQTVFEPGQRHSTPVGMWIAVKVTFALFG